MDAVSGVCAIATCLMPCVTAQLVVNYRKKTPLGSQLGIDCELVSDEELKDEKNSLSSGVFTRKLKIKIKLYSLKNPEVVYADGFGIFVNAMLPSKKEGESIIPPFFSFLRPSSTHSRL